MFWNQTQGNSLKKNQQKTLTPLFSNVSKTFQSNNQINNLQSGKNSNLNSNLGNQNGLFSKNNNTQTKSPLFNITPSDQQSSIYRNTLGTSSTPQMQNQNNSIKANNITNPFFNNQNNTQKKGLFSLFQKSQQKTCLFPNMASKQKNQNNQIKSQSINGIFSGFNRTSISNPPFLKADQTAKNNTKNQNQFLFKTNQSSHPNNKKNILEKTLCHNCSLNINNNSPTTSLGLTSSNKTNTNQSFLNKSPSFGLLSFNQNNTTQPLFGQQVYPNNQLNQEFLSCQNTSNNQVNRNGNSSIFQNTMNTNNQLESNCFVNINSNSNMKGYNVNNNEYIEQFKNQNTSQKFQKMIDENHTSNTSFNINQSGNSTQINHLSSHPQTNSFNFSQNKNQIFASPQKINDFDESLLKNYYDQGNNITFLLMQLSSYVNNQNCNQKTDKYFQKSALQQLVNKAQQQKQKESVETNNQTFSFQQILNDFTIPRIHRNQVHLTEQYSYSEQRRSPNRFDNFSPNLSQTKLIKVKSNQRQASKIKRQNLPLIEGYEINPSFDELKNMKIQQLKQLHNFVVSNQYGSIKFKQPINIFEKNISKSFLIEQDLVQIKDNEFELKRCQLTFKNFSRYTDLSQNDKLKTIIKMNKWIKKMNMKLIDFSERTGKLTVQI